MKSTAHASPYPVAALAAALACSACAGAKPAAPAAKAQSAAPLPVQAQAPASAPAAAVAAVPIPATVPMPQGVLHRLTAVVKSADGAGGALTVVDKAGKTRVFRVAAGAGLTKGGNHAAIALSDVAPGDHVSLRFSGDVAASVHVNVLAAN